MPFMRFLAKDPLVGFVVIALLLFGLEAFNRKQTLPPLRITAQEQAALVRQAAALKGSALTAEEVQSEIARAVDRKVLFNETVRLGLHQDGSIEAALIRHYRQLLTAELPAPTDEELRAYYQDHITQFMGQPQIEFELYLLPPTANAPPKLPPDSVNFTDMAAWLGMAPLKAQQLRLNAMELSQLYGADIAQRLQEAPLQQWQGPLTNVHGLFYVRALNRFDASPQPYALCHNYVRDAWRRAREDALVQARLEALKPGYRIYVD